MLGTIFEFSENFYDLNEARRWFRMAAKQGHAAAQFNLAWIESSLPEIEKWYQMAAEQGHAAAQYKLGELFEFRKKN